MILEIFPSKTMPCLDHDEYMAWLQGESMRLLVRSSAPRPHFKWEDKPFDKLRPYQRLLLVLKLRYGRFIAEDSAREMLYPGIPREQQFAAIRNRIYFIRKRRKGIPKIMDKPETGFAMGVDRLDLTATQLTIFFPMFLNRHRPVPMARLCRMLGLDVENPNDRSLVSTHISDLRKRIEKTRSQIETVTYPETKYILHY